MQYFLHVSGMGQAMSFLGMNIYSRTGIWGHCGGTLTAQAGPLSKLSVKTQWLGSL